MLSFDQDQALFQHKVLKMISFTDQAVYLATVEEKCNSAYKM